MASGEPGEIEATLRRYGDVYRWFLIRVEPFIPRSAPDRLGTAICYNAARLLRLTSHMSIQWIAGMALVSLAGVMQGAFAFPMKFTRRWAWENIWLASSFFGLVFIPWLIALYTVPLISVVLASCPSRAIIEVFLFGAGWGIGGMLFGLGVHRVGLSLALAVVVGLTSIVGCIVPLALFHPERLLDSTGVLVIFAVSCTLGGLVLCTFAGQSREVSMSADGSAAASARGSYWGGLAICILSGLLSPLFNFALIYGGPVIIAATRMGASRVEAPNLIWAIAMTGGMVPTAVYCGWLLHGQRTWTNFGRAVWHDGIFDGINNEALQKASIEGGRLKFGQGDYSVLVLPEITGLPVETMEKINAFRKASGKVIAIGHTPSLCYGLPQWREKSTRVRQLAADLFSKSGGGVLVPDTGDTFLQALRRSQAPDIDFERADPMVGFVHRRTDNRDFYFIANMTPEPKQLRGVFRVGQRQPQFWDAIAGTTRLIAEYAFIQGGTEVPFDLGPYESTIVTFGRSTEPALRQARRPARLTPGVLRIKGPWRLDIAGATITVQKLGSWTEDERFRYFSGAGVYTTDFNLEVDYLARGLKLWLCLGSVREIAEVELNGRAVGVAWMLPYSLDITAAARKGNNQLVVKVTNLLMNRVLGQPRPDVAAITEKFGPASSQDPEMLPHFHGTDLKWEQNFEKNRVKSPLPSGLIGEVEIRPAWQTPAA